MAKKFVFEQAMDRLEAIVRALEEGDAPLEQSLALFQEGAKLIEGCTKALDQAQQQVKLLSLGESGPREQPFLPEEEA